VIFAGAVIISFLRARHQKCYNLKKNEHSYKDLAKKFVEKKNEIKRNYSFHLDREKSLEEELNKKEKNRKTSLHFKRKIAKRGPRRNTCFFVSKK
jgi:hypothetical protein